MPGGNMARLLGRGAALALAALGAGVLCVRGAEGPGAGKVEAGLRELDAKVLPAEGLEVPPSKQLARHVRAGLEAANRRETRAWEALRSRADWEQYRAPRIRALRESLGTFPPPADLKVHVTGTIAGTGFAVEKLAFVSRPGLVVTANLYRPEPAGKSMPGILVCHSHHNPKTEGELQDMGATWARQGGTVLVMDQLGHGERRQHPFVDAKSYPRPFRVGRQDYYFRYNVGLQLHLIGESLAGWMVWDLLRGVDLLLARPGIDRERIILLGAVAGGGDPAAVAAALDPRIRAVVPFNFGGPQPETTYPLPEKAEAVFNYAGSGSWESTRNLRLSARDGFAPWAIVGAAAPRGLVYAHEFSWDRERDPVWARLEKIYGWYGAGDRLASCHGKGKVTGKPPEASHCNNIGPLQRQGIYPAFKRWFDLPVPAAETKERHSAAELACLTPELAKELDARPVHRLAAELGAERAAAALRRLPDLPADRRKHLRKAWAALLGGVEPPADVKVVRESKEKMGDVTVERLALEMEHGLLVPLLLLVPAHAVEERPPVVVAFAQEGKQALLKGCAADVAELLRGGVAVCLPDLRGTGETHPGDGRGRQSTATGLASTEQMLGATLLGERLRDLRSVLRYLRGRRDLDAARLALWGDSFAAANLEDRQTAVPWDADPLPDQSEPLGGLLALFGALFEEDVQAVCARGGLVGYASLLESPFVYVPYDAILPGALTAGDLNDVAAALAPRPLRLEGLVNGLNQLVAPEALAALEPVRSAYRSAAPERLQVLRKAPENDPPGRWLLARLRGN
jgi:dienelactone hydrolase